MFNSVGCHPIKIITENLKAIMFHDQQNRLEKSCKTFPKLRTFVEIKDFNKTSPCLTLALSFIQRSTITKARLGCLPIRLETGRYTRPYTTEERYCIVCSNPNREVECIYHVLFSCNVYSYERKIWWDQLLLSEYFLFLTKEQQLTEEMSNPHNVKNTSKFILLCMDKRSKMIGI